MTDNIQRNKARRRIIKRLAVGGGIVATGHVMPDKWAKPVVESVILPSHAQVSPGTGPGGPVPINVLLQTAFTVDGNSLND